MAWYAAGTVALTNGNAAVIGTGTSFLTKVKSGDMFVPDDGANAFYEIAEITSSLQLVLKKPYQGVTTQGVTYAIVPTQSYLKELAAQVTDLITIYSDVPANVEAAEAAMIEAQAARSAAVNAQAASESARDAAEVWKAAAAASAQSASLSAGDAGNAQAAAETARDASQTAQGITLAARDITLTARDDANASKLAASASAAQAAQSASDAAVNLTEVTATADNALSVAQGIDGKAQTALDNSSSAVSTANAAQSTANGIDGKAQTALDNSVAATSTANAAQADVDALEVSAIRKDGSVQYTGHQKLKDNAPTDALHAASKGYVDNFKRGALRKLRGQTVNTPNTVSFSADYARMLSTNAALAPIEATAGFNLTADQTVVGANGRDQAGAFGVGVWTYCYLIGGSGQSNALLLSLSATNPTLPSGYTHRKFLAPVRNGKSASTAFFNQWYVDDRVQYHYTDMMIYDGAPLTDWVTMNNVPLWVPPLATTWDFGGTYLGVTDGSGILEVQLLVAFESTLKPLCLFTDIRQRQSGNTYTSTSVVCPNVINTQYAAAKTILINWNSNMVLQLWVQGYRFQNNIES